MYRGTTPTLEFVLPIECAKIDYVSIAFAQEQGRYSRESALVLEKTLADCTANGNTLSLPLSELDTLRLDASRPVEIQLRIKCAGKSMASDIITESVGRILRDGVLP